MTPNPLVSLGAAAMLELQERQYGGHCIEVVTEDKETGELVSFKTGQRYARAEWEAKASRPPRGWFGVEVVYVNSDDGERI
jgi:hypothetical protein